MSMQLKTLQPRMAVCKSSILGIGYLIKSAQALYVTLKSPQILTLSVYFFANSNNRAAQHAVDTLSMIPFSSILLSVLSTFSCKAKGTGRAL